jgi:hypothetical protein
MPFDQVQANIISHVNFGLLVATMAVAITIFTIIISEKDESTVKSTIISTVVSGGSASIAEYITTVVKATNRTVPNTVSAVGGVYFGSTTLAEDHTYGTDIFSISNTEAIAVHTTEKNIKIEKFTVGDYGEPIVFKNTASFSDTYATQDSEQRIISGLRNFVVNVKFIKLTGSTQLTTYDLSTSPVSSGPTSAAILTTFSPYFSPSISFFKGTNNGILYGLGTGSGSFVIVPFSVNSSAVTIGNSINGGGTINNIGNNLSTSSTKIFIGNSNRITRVTYVDASNVTVDDSSALSETIIPTNAVIIGNEDNSIIGFVVDSGNLHTCLLISTSDFTGAFTKHIISVPFNPKLQHEKPIKLTEMIDSFGLNLVTYGNFATAITPTKTSFFIKVSTIDVAPTVTCVPNGLFPIYDTTATHVDFIHYKSYATKVFFDYQYRQMFPSEKNGTYIIGKSTTTASADETVEYQPIAPIISGFVDLQPGHLYFTDKATGKITNNVNFVNSFLGIALDITNIMAINSPIDEFL